MMSQRSSHQFRFFDNMNPPLHCRLMHKLTNILFLAFCLQSLLCDPNPNSPANSEAARLFSENKREYNRKVMEIVEQSYA